MQNQLTLTAALVMSVAALSAAPANDQPEQFEVRSGKITFDVATSVSALSVHGESTAMRALVHLQRTAENLVVEKIEASLSPSALSTGMGLRDEHMRKYIFTTPDGQVPDLRFVAGKQLCPATASGREVACPLTGEMTIRGVTKPFAITLKVKEDGKGGFHAAGDSLVKLSDYGIPAPSQFGVKTAEEVKMRFDFTSRRGGELSSKAGTQ